MDENEVKLEELMHLDAQYDKEITMLESELNKLIAEQEQEQI